MTKPFSPRELVLRANNLLNRVQKCMNLQSCLKFGALELNDTQKRALIYDEPVNLRIKEFELLWYLGKHENEVISKSELIQEVWQYDYYEDVNTVNVHIHRLREKFEQFNYRDYTIKTVWGLGYTFERNLI